MKEKAKEILFTNEQAEKMLKLLNGDIKESEKKEEKSMLKKNLEKAVQSFFNLIIMIFTLKDTGKWISVISLITVLSMFFKFLQVNGYSVVAMTLIAPYLGEIAIVVFSVIGGVKGAQSIVDKVMGHKSLLKAVKKDDNEKNG